MRRHLELLLTILIIGVLPLCAQECISLKDVSYERHEYFGYDLSQEADYIYLEHAGNEKVERLDQLSIKANQRVNNEDQAWIRFCLNASANDSLAYISFGHEQLIGWSKIHVYAAADTLMRHPYISGHDIRPIDKQLSNSHNILGLPLSSGDNTYIAHLGGITQVENNQRELPLLTIYKNDHHDIDAYEYPGRYHHSGGLLYGFNLIKQSIEVLTDPDGSYDISEVINKWDEKAWLSRNEYPREDYTYWMKLKIRNTESTPRSYLLGFNSGTIWAFDTIEIFAPLEIGNYRISTIGNKISRSKRPFHTWSNVFQTELSAQSEKEIYLRVKGFSDRFIPDFQVSHIDEHEFWSVTQWVFLGYGIFIGLLVLQLTYYLFRYFLERDPIHIALVIFVLGIGLWALFIVTDFHFVIFPQLSDRFITIACLGSVLQVVGLYAFIYYLLDLDQYDFDYRRLFIILTVIHIILTLNFGSSFSSFAVVPPISESYTLLYMFSTMANFFVPFVIGWLLWYRGNTMARYFSIAFTTLILGLLIRFVMGLISFTSDGFFNQYLVFLGIYAQYFWFASIIITLMLLSFITSFQILELKAQKTEGDKTRAISEARNKFYTNITHEFRTPLTVISGLADNMKDSEASKEIILRNSDQLLGLVNQVLDLSRLDSNTLELEEVSTEAISFIEYVVESFHDLARTHGIELTSFSEIGELWMLTDQDKLQSIVSNLITNAIKYGKKGGKIVIQLSTHTTDDAHQNLIIKVRDNGIGIAQKDLPHIFDRYYQAANRGTDHAGTGIGLSYVKSIVEIMGGSIKAESIIDKGSLFSCTIPVTPTEPNHESSSKPNRKSSYPIKASDKSSSISDDQPTILIVEDNQDVQYYLSSILQGSYQLVCATNGTEGIDMALDTVPDIIISDVMMPLKDGYELCREVKTNEITNHIPIILLTAKIKGNIEGLDSGADVYITKPFQKEELLLNIRNLLHNRKVMQEKYSDAPSEESDPFIKKIDDIIDENIADENFGTIALSMKMRLSRSQLFRKVKAITGLSVSEYIRKKRMKAATDLLRNTDLSIAEVAYRVGYKEGSNFSTAYKAEYGSPPSATRK